MQFVIEGEGQDNDTCKLDGPEGKVGGRGRAPAEGASAENRGQVEQDLGWEGCEP